jgi:pilus assembly protein CpaE
VDDVEDALGYKVYWKIPNSYFAVMSAINKGVPISSISPNSNIDMNFTELAAKLSDSVIIKNVQTRTKSKSFELPFNLNLDSLKNFKLFNK